MSPIAKTKVAAGFFGGFVVCSLCSGVWQMAYGLATLREGTSCSPWLQGLPSTWFELHSGQASRRIPEGTSGLRGPLLVPVLQASSRSLYIRSCMEDVPSTASIDAS